MKKKIITILIVILVITLLLIALAGYFFTSIPEKTVVTPVTKVPVKTLYNIPLDSLEVVYGTVKANQNLSSLLSGFIPPTIIDQISKKAGAIFDVRKIKTGNRIARLMTKDTLKTTKYFVYEINPIDYVVFDFSDSLRVYAAKKPVARQIRTATGTIKSSLWNCFVENNLDVDLALAMSDVYAWTVDFYGLQKGDHFKVIFEEVYVDNNLVGIDRIIAARFTSSGKDFFAYRFEQAGKAEYFDGKGQSLQRSFLKAPLKFSRISSRFSKSRMHPILRIARPHFGVDYSAPRGTPVVSLGDGRIGEVGYKGGYGKFISVRHNSVYITTYAHLSGYAKGIKSGVHVSQGQLIGYVGSTGLATGPHLDFRVYKNGTPVDPLKMESPPSKPVDPVNMKTFLDLVKKTEGDLK